MRIRHKLLQNKEKIKRTDMLLGPGADTDCSGRSGSSAGGEPRAAAACRLHPATLRLSAASQVNTLLFCNTGDRTQGPGTELHPTILFLLRQSCQVTKL